MRLPTVFGATATSHAKDVVCGTEAFCGDKTPSTDKMNCEFCENNTRSVEKGTAWYKMDTWLSDTAKSMGSVSCTSTADAPQKSKKEAERDKITFSPDKTPSLFLNKRYH